MPTWNEAANEIFLQALDHDSPARRRAYLDDACGTDAELRAEVESLLEACEQIGGFLESPLSTVALSFDQPAAEQPGTMIGPYKLIEELGEGGMGSVFLALQKTPVRRQVALKIIKAGMDSKQVVSRFEAERQALAMMDHPNIARVFDGAATESGRPFFVMELVDGIPITDYCDRERLTTDQRLELFNDVCRAVQHAHQKGIIHRDLKPSNILVTLLDGRAVPKVIDFGIAKATNGHLMDGSMVTACSQLIGTPMYMSPEQADSSAVDVDTRSDVYSLGVLLYELLTGTTPFDRERMSSESFDEFRRIVREEDPPRPSTRLSTLDAALDTVADKHHTDPRTLSQQVRGELDWIAMKALEKDRTRRYETANDFARDIQRYLNDEAVEACPPSAKYRLGKFIRRYKTGLVATIAVSLALITGMSLALWQASVARKAAARATMEYDRAQKTLGLALNTVDEIYSTVTGERDRTAPLNDPIKLEVLAKTRIFYEALVQLNPTNLQVQQQHAIAYKRLGHLYEGLGDYLTADAAYGNATALFQELATSHPSEPGYRLQLGNCYVSRGWVRFCSNQKAEGLAMLDQAVTNLADLAATAPADPEYTSAWTLALCMRGLWYYGSGRPHESLDDFHAAFQAQKPIVAAFPDKPWYRYILASAYHNYATSLAAEGRFDDAEPYFCLALEEEQRVLQDEPADPAFRWLYAVTHERLAAALAGAEKWEEAAVACQQSNELHKGVTTDFPKTPVYRMTYVPSLLTSASVRAQFDDWVAVDQHFRLAVEQAESMVALSDQDQAFCGTWAFACQKYAEFLISTDRHRDAEKLYRKSLGRLEQLIAGAPEQLAYRDPYVSGVINMTTLLAQDSRYDEATSLHQNAVCVLDAAIAALADKDLYSGEDRAQALNNLAWLLSATPIEALRDPAKALQLANEAVQLLPRGDIWNTLGLAYYRADQFPESINALETSLKMLGDAAFGNNAFPLAMIHHRLGHEEEARTWYDRGVQKIEVEVLRSPGLMRLRAEAAEVLGIEEAMSEILGDNTPGAEPWRAQLRRE